MLEQAVIDLLASYRVRAERREGAPGVYVNDAKVAALGLRVSRGCSYHGLSLNVDNDLAPFADIDPCGYPGLTVTRTRDLGVIDGRERLGEQLAALVTTALQRAAANSIRKPAIESTA
jgi:lipoyl(octanoyl) transferase